MVSTDPVMATMPLVCPSCGAETDPMYKHHEPEVRFFQCGCAYERFADGFAHLHDCKLAYVMAVIERGNHA